MAVAKYFFVSLYAYWCCYCYYVVVPSHHIHIYTFLVWISKRLTKNKNFFLCIPRTFPSSNKCCNALLTISQSHRVFITLSILFYSFFFFLSLRYTLANLFLIHFGSHLLHTWILNLFKDLHFAPTTISQEQKPCVFGRRICNNNNNNNKYTKTQLEIWVYCIKFKLYQEWWNGASASCCTLT